MPENEKIKHGAVRDAYREVGQYYRSSVEVTKYTWTAFRLRSSGLLIAAAYIVVKYPHWSLIAAIVMAGAAVMAFVTSRQMDNNQKVIQRALAAGASLEFQNPELGFLYRNTIPQAERTHFNETYSDSNAQNQIIEEDIAKMGLIPETETLCKVYSGIFAIGALVSIGYYLYLKLYGCVPAIS